jgi:squalene-hopene/tetraprenyl-beta-curcumene cyclase
MYTTRTKDLQMNVPLKQKCLAFASIAACLVLSSLPAFCGDWNSSLAAQYLDSRQKAWFAWPPATSQGVACISCHTGVPYLLARPALRQALGETSPTLYEAELLDGVRATVFKKDAKAMFPELKGPAADRVFGAQAVLAALLLATDDAPRGRLSAVSDAAFQRMWSVQISAGDAKGAWYWSEFDLDPWEMPESVFYGAALGALATGTAPAGYQSRPDIRDNVSSLTAYLRGAQKTQPLHNRLILLWASTKLRDLLPENERQSILDEVFRKQEPDGGWAMESLGAWKKRPDAPTANGSSSYATGLVAFTLQQAGVQPSEPGVAHALNWLRAHQDRQSGYWAADSMNHRYEEGSMPQLFMRDAATSYATLALLVGGKTR